MAYARRRTTPEEAQEVVAETFLVVWRRLDDVPKDPLPWLLQSARRVLANRRRGARRRASLVEKVQVQPPAPSGGFAEDVVGSLGIETAMARLSEQDRELLMLVYWDDLSHSQASKVLGCSSATVAVRLHRARRRLEKELVSGGHIEGEGTRNSPLKETP
jgi:RNA polymerase sigma-70 factor (ECF subfamily)